MIQVSVCSVSIFITILKICSILCLKSDPGLELNPFHYFFQGTQQQQEENEKNDESSSIMNLDTNKDASMEVSVDSSEDPETFTCHQDYDAYMHYVLDLKFWLECVLLSIIGAFGFLGNIITFIVLKGQVCT